MTPAEHVAAVFAERFDPLDAVSSAVKRLRSPEIADDGEPA